MKTKYKEEMFEKEKQFLVLNDNGRVYRVLKVAEDEDKLNVRFYLFGGKEIDHPSSVVETFEENNFIKFFIGA